MRRSGLWLLLASSCALGCQGGPIGDFPRGSEDSEGQGAGGPAIGPGGGASLAGGVAGGAAAGGSTSGSDPNQPVVPGGASPAPGQGGTVGLDGAAGGLAAGGASNTGGATGGLAGTGAVAGGTGGVGGATGGVLGGLAGGGSTGGFGGLSDGGGDPTAPDAGSSADAGPALDAGVAPPSDGGTPDGSQPDADAIALADAGLCPTSAVARVDGGCQGSYCNLTLTALSGSTQPGSCVDEPTLRLACDAQLARKSAQCAQDNALSLSLGSAVRGCLRRDPQLSFVDESCLDCLTSELTCTLSNCLALCVLGLDEECTSCRRTSCGAEFTRCSGLPGL